MSGREEQRRREAHTLLASRRARSETQREVLKLLTAGIKTQVSVEEAAALTVGWLQAQLGMTKPLSEVRDAMIGREQAEDRNSPCALCGGPHDFDTSVPSAVWNRVIRAKGMSEYLCTTCIVREFVRANEGFTATLWNEEFYGVPIEVVVNGKNANDATLVSDENTAYRVRIEELETELTKLRTALAEAVAQERERCARIADAVHESLYHGVDYGDSSIAQEIAAAIRVAP